MKRPRMVVTRKDKVIEDLANRTNHKGLAIWAADCAERVLPYFEKRRPMDDRPRRAIEEARAWARTGEFKISVVRNASLEAHAAAREVQEDDAARSAAHVPRHAIAAAIYAATSVRDSADDSEADTAAEKEREWQYRHLLDLVKIRDDGRMA
jgi:hypothetical protein